MTELHHYRIFDTCISSDFPLPELPEANCEAGLHVQLGAPPAEDLLGLRQTKDWTGPEGELICSVASRENNYLFQWPGYSGFFISDDGQIFCMPEADCSMSLVSHFLVNQVIPRYLGSGGAMVVHAGAVTTQDGKTAAFLGPSGFGKSTLVSGLHRSGAELIADDCIMLSSESGKVRVLGAFPGMRLFPDSLEAVFSEAAGLTSITPYAQKQQLILQDLAGQGMPAWQDLDAVFLLNNPDEPADSISITPAKGSEALMALVTSVFCLDPSDVTMTVQSFRSAGAAISEGVPFYHLNYPRELHQLDALCNEIQARLVAS